MTVLLNDYAAEVDRFGVETGTVRWHADTLEEARSVGDAFMGGVPLVSRRWSRDLAGSYDVSCSYEGRSSGNPPPSPEVNESVEGEVTFIHQPIETHPRLSVLLEKFGGSIGADGKVKFSAQLPASKSGTGFGTKKSTNANPLYGLTTFAVAGMEVVHTFIDDRLSDAVTRDLNEILTELPSSVPSRGRPSTPPGRNWMVMSPRWVQRGNVVQIFKRYRLSPPGGFSRELYALLISGT